MTSTNPYAYPPFTCASCYWYEIPARADHGILPKGSIFCRRCLEKYDGEIAVLAPDRAAAVAVLTARGLMTPATPKPATKETKK